MQVLKWCSVGACAGQCRCVCSAVLKWCSAVQVDCMGYMGHMGLCVISVKKLVNEGIRLYKRIGKWIVWDI